MNTLETLKALVAQLEAEQVQTQSTTLKPRCDAQGRLLANPIEKGIYYWIDGASVESQRFHGPILDNELLDIGVYFVSEPAAEAELTRLKCLQRLRGMDGFTPYGKHLGSIVGYNTQETCDAAEATITPEERAAFLYREPMGEK